MFLLVNKLAKSDSKKMFVTKMIMFSQKQESNFNHLKINTQLVVPTRISSLHSVSNSMLFNTSLKMCMQNNIKLKINSSENCWLNRVEYSLCLINRNFSILKFKKAKKKKNSWKSVHCIHEMAIWNEGECGERERMWMH